MRAFVVLCLVFSIPSQVIDLGKRLRNDLFCVECAVKTTTQSINQSVNQPTALAGKIMRSVVSVRPSVSSLAVESTTRLTVALDFCRS